MNRIDRNADPFTRATHFLFEQPASWNPRLFLAVSVILLLTTAGCDGGGGSSTNNAATVPDAVEVEDPDPAETPVAAIRINEFLASNDSGLADEDGDFSDWIELRNTGDTPIDLQGWYLTDDEQELTKWPLPSETVAPDEFLVIFASGKDRGTAAGEEPHTNFKLSSDGEYLALVQADGVTIADEYTPEFPPQTTDVSYGHISDAEIGFLESPTAGAANSREAVAGVEFSRPAGVFTNSLTLTIALGEGRAGTIYYSIDGTAPTPESLQYDGPVTVTQTTLVRARAFDAETEGSAGPDNFAFYGIGRRCRGGYF